MNEEQTEQVKTKNLCFHCGDICSDEAISIEEKYFCCTGCKTVYEILQENKLCQYYDLNNMPGISGKTSLQQTKYEFLDDPDVKAKLVSFTDGQTATLTFFIPQMHCSSCIWLLENLYKFNSGIMQSQVNFLQKQITIKYREKETTLRKVVELLSSVGYSPEINLNDIAGKKSEYTVPKSLYYKIGIAGFCFGNIMLLSFPEYLSIVNAIDPFLRQLFGYLIIVLSLPVFFYCSSDYYVSAWRGLTRGVINIDFPLSLGIIALFIRSLLEILTHTAPGYMDSLAGLLFFLLTGKLFQNKTFETLNFERNYKSYFPVAVTLKKDGREISVPVSKIKPGDRILVRNNELIPADTIIIKGNGFIDYSFVTGESKPVEKLTGDMIYAGGKQTGTAIELEVIKETSQSYLTQLWNQDLSKQNENKIITLSNLISKYFTLAILLIATLSALYWLQTDLSKALNVFTAVLIIACPCALALSTPFTFGNTMRIFGKNKFYIKNTSIIEKLARINSIVFDKTGTLTKANEALVTYSGESLNHSEEILVKSLVRNSTHPLSFKINSLIQTDQLFEVKDFCEIAGKGLEGKINGSIIKLGSRSYVSGVNKEQEIGGGSTKNFDTTVYLAINDEIKGYFKINNYYREGLKQVIDSLKHFELSLLSGDNEGEKETIKNIFPEGSRLHFRQTPENKLEFVKSLQAENKKVLMVGDGLNDAGALLKSDVGISISEDTGNFSPACDAILDASVFRKLGDFLQFSRLNLKIIKTSFMISLIYNIIGLSFAIKGDLSPLIAAILMPLSSVTVVSFTTLATNFMAGKRGLL